MSEVVMVNPPPRHYYAGLDGIRGIGCFFVLFIHFHFTYANVPFTIALTCLHSFFIMSAFLITRNLLKEKNRTQGFSRFFRAFYIKRTARIFPVYFLYIFVVIFLFVFIKAITGQSAMGVIPELKRYGWMLFTFVYNLKMQLALCKGYSDYMACFLFPHLWSVALEEQFYFMVIFLLWICSARSLKVISILFIVVIPVVRVWGYYAIGRQTSDDFLRTLAILHSPYYQFDAFFYGIAMAAFDFKKSRAMLHVFWITLSIIALHAIVSSSLIASEQGIPFFKAIREDRYFYHHYGIWFLDIAMNLFSCAWIYCVLYYPEKFSFFSRKMIVKFGELSYGLYIFQFLVLGAGVLLTAVLMKFLHFPAVIAEVIGFATYLVLNYYLAIWINHKIEKPVAIYKDKLLKKMNRQKHS
jgi:peptidoglycan/LPS O-acetylase OafA/YrhL